ncbi:error-prone DNA polymerase [Rhizomicrobium electricum]|uniref:Error-prone DNA polymerase n=1 Tax=Rhizomicrobium electricum TaxID=480070 RepID=A0ABN1EU51_9PROT|nr:error-prone DNA polymerase [Rhizomicrobium electricum]NIJ49658.1 error-prone DNA polymerase [Rhizomicrobium electricum]
MTGAFSRKVGSGFRPENATTRYAEIAAATNFSFLHGASHPKEVIAAATLLGYAAIGIADRNSLAGVVRAYAAWEQIEGDKPKLLVGARLVFADGTPDILAYPSDRAAYGRLCRLLSQGKLRAPKGDCILTLKDLQEWQGGMLLTVMAPRPGRRSEPVSFKPAWNTETDAVLPAPVATDEAAIRDLLAMLADMAPGRVWLGVSMPLHGDDFRRLRRWQTVAQDAGVPLIATNDALYHAPDRHPLQDVITCIREHVTLDTAGRLLEANAERHLKDPEEMAELFAAAPEAVAETLRFADRVGFTLDQIKYNYPADPVPAGKTAQQHLEDLTWAGAHAHYHGNIPDKVRAVLEKELHLIGKMQIAPYFLTVYDIVSFAKSEDILCQGRGSAANSAVCFVLGITAVDPTEVDLLFERFVSEERKEPPDIDVDFEHERREEVIQNVYDRYGRHRAALTGTVICYRPRSAIREVGKVFGLTEDVTTALASGVWGSWGSRLKDSEVRQGLLDPQNLVIAQAVRLANVLIGFPRHLSQHVGGFVLTEDRLDEIVPVGPATMKDRWFIEWDKDDLDTLRMMKVDVLALGMLTCIRKAFDLIRVHERKPYRLATIPREDPAVYAMLQNADAIGVFQVESRAQMNMLPRLRPKKFYDLVIEVAIVRPGPIQGDMVHPYLRRRNHQEDVTYPSPSPEHGPPDELHQVLSKTMGVPLFQEQAMKLAIVAAKFSAEEANGLRRAMATFRNVGTIDTFKAKFVGRMVERGYDPDYAERCFRQIEGFGSYGFPESHAASFAHLVYVSAYIKKHHPAAFCCALLNSQPMGFYAPAEIVRDAREHGVEVRPIDVNFSEWDNILEPGPDGPAVRLGLRQVEGFRQDWAGTLVSRRGNGYRAVESLAKRTDLPRRALIILAEADSFQSIAIDRREILWAVRRIADPAGLPLFDAQYVDIQEPEEIAPLPVMPQSEHVLADYQMLRLSLRAHLMQFLRDVFRGEGVKSCAEIAAGRDGEAVSVAGIVLVRQMPGEAGVVFITLSDETGIANVVVWPRLVETFRREIMGARLLLVQGRIQRSPENVIHLVAERVIDRSTELERLSEDSAEAPPFRSQAAVHLHRHPRNVRIVPKSRDFH